MPTALVLGGGISGLTAAWSLQQKGFEVRVLEAAPQLGGALASIQKDGYLIEAGAQSLLAKSPRTHELLEALQLKSEVLQSNPAAAHRFIFHDGEAHALPTNPSDMLQSSLLTMKSKIKLLAAARKKTAAAKGPESLADFARRHFNQEILDRGVQAFATGTFAGDAENLSVQDAFGFLLKAEAMGEGCLIQGLQKLGAQNEKPQLISFKNGLQSLPKALAQQLKQAPQLNAKVIRIEGPPWKIDFETPEGQRSSENPETLILAMPAHAIAKLPLPEKLKQALEPLSKIHHPPLCTVALGYPKARIGHPLKGFGVLFAKDEQSKASGILFSSSIFEGRAPKDHALLTIFLGGALQPEASQGTAEALIKRARTAAEICLKAEGEPTFTHLSRWEKSIPQYALGHAERLASLEEQLPESLKLLGSFKDGVALEDCLLNAEALAQKIA